MKKPSCRQHERASLMRDVRQMRTMDCTWPRRGQGRPRCGVCMDCEHDAVFESAARRVH